MATKDDLIQAGCYVAIPLAVLCQDDLTATAKGVYGALLFHLRGTDEWVFPSVRRLSGLVGAGRTAVLKALADLEAVGLIERDRCPGTRTRYRFLPIPATGPESGPVDPQSSPECGPVRNPDRSALRTSPVRNADATGPESGPRTEALEETLKEVLPPAPHRGDASETVLLEAIGAAYRDVFGRGLPRKWKRAIRREVADGDPTRLADIDAVAIRGAVARARDARGTFGLGWVLRFVDDRSAMLRQRAAQSAGPAGPCNQPPTPKAAESGDDARAALAHFERLPDDQREAFRAAVRADRFAPTKPDLLERMAAWLAWKRTDKRGAAG